MENTPEAKITNADMNEALRALVTNSSNSLITNVKVFNAENYGTLSSSYPSEFLVNTTSQS